MKALEAGREIPLFFLFAQANRMRNSHPIQLGAHWLSRPKFGGDSSKILPGVLPTFSLLVHQQKGSRAQTLAHNQQCCWEDTRRAI